jgi:hypothetical protein
MILVLVVMFAALVGESIRSVAFTHHQRVIDQQTQAVPPTSRAAKNAWRLTGVGRLTRLMATPQQMSLAPQYVQLSGAQTICRPKKPHG